MNSDGFTTFGVRVENAIAWVTFDYLPVNIRGLPMLADLNNLAQKLEADDTVKVVVFQSAHAEIFVAQADTSFLKDMSGKAVSRGEAKLLDLQVVLERISKLPQATIAKIEGFARGGGHEFALDVRFAVNTLAPYLLTQKLLPLLGASGRVINLSSAAQSPVETDALAGRVRLSDDFNAYAQSKLALTMWSRAMALSLDADCPAIIAVNPGSMLGTKMVEEGFGVAGGDVRTGAEILVRAALEEEFAAASGQCFDNDKGRFAQPHRDALDPRRSQEIIRTMGAILSEKTRPGQTADVS